MVTHSRSKTTLMLIAVGLVCGLIVAACGGDDQESAPAPEPASAPAESVAEPAAPAAESVGEDMSDDQDMAGDEHMSESEGGMDDDHMSDSETGMDEHAHDETVEAPADMSVSFELEPDPVGGFNVRIVPTGFVFTPENVNGENVAGEGHAHLYVDGEKVGRVYTEWYHLDGLTPGEHEVRVTLNANSHAEYVHGAETVAATTSVDVPEPPSDEEEHAMEHSHESVEAPEGMAVSFELEPDPVGGFNVRIVPTGFVFTPENVNGEDVAGEGHAHLYVDGEKVARVYGEWYHLDGLTPGEHQVRVTLNSNTHAEYARSGEAVDAELTVSADGEVSEHDHDADSDTDMHEDGDHASGTSVESGAVIELVDGMPVGGVKRIEVKNGERAAFTVTSDTAGEVHVHGFDLVKNVGPGMDASFDIETSFEGIFEIELHSSDGETEIASLVIEPS